MKVRGEREEEEEEEEVCVEFVFCNVTSPLCIVCEVNCSASFISLLY